MCGFVTGSSRSRATPDAPSAGPAQNRERMENSRLSTMTMLVVLSFAVAPLVRF
jgi:hypothetical protein